MAATIDFANLGTLSPEDYAEQQALSKKQRLAQSLLSSSMQTPQGQMVSGHYVAPSWAQALNPLAQAMAGKFLESQGDKEAVDYATRVQARDQEEMRTGLELLRGRDGAEPNPTAGMDYLLSGKGKAAQALGAKLLENEFKNPNYEYVKTVQGGNDVLMQVDKNKGWGSAKPVNSASNMDYVKAGHTGMNIPNQGVSMYGGGTMQPNPLNPVPMGGAPAANPNNFVNMAQAQNLPIISGVRTPEQQMGLVASQTPDGKFLTKEGRPVAVNSQHLHGNAIDIDPNKPVTPAQQAWLQQYAVQGKGKDSNHYELKPEFRGQQMPTAGAPAQAPTIDAIRQKYMLQETPNGYKTPEAKLRFYEESVKPLDGKAADKVAGGQDVIATVSDLRAALKDWQKDDIYKPDKVAMMQGLVSNANMAIKDAKGLGVLNAPDLPQIEAMIANPTKWQTLLTNKDTFEKLYTNQIDSAQRTIHNQYINSRRQMPEETIQLMMGIDKDREDRAAAKAKPAGKTEPKAADVTAVKSWLAQNKIPFEPDIYTYPVVNGEIRRVKRKQ